MLDPDHLDVGSVNVVDDEDHGLTMKAIITPNNRQQHQQQHQQQHKKATFENNALNVWAEEPKPRKRQRFQHSSSNGGGSRFQEMYRLTGETLGRGAYARVEACVNRLSDEQYAVKIIEKQPNHSRMRVIKEIELFHTCAGHPNIVQLLEYFEEDDKFYLIFEMMRGGPLLSHIQRKICFTENEACLVVRDIANALKFLHDRGIAHRDLKPENILCTYPDTVSPVKLCDLDLASKNNVHAVHSITTPELQSPVGSAEFMAPEVVDAFVGESLFYDKRCDLWSLGVILYILLCGYPPFYGECNRQDCGWNQGLSCNDCQESLFTKIQSGNFEFPPQEWDFISQDAIDLITHLLEKDVKRRYSVDDVLRHPFIVNEAPKTPLQTPNILLRNDSSRDLLENFAAFDRLKLHQRLSMGDGSGSEANRTSSGFFAPPTMGAKLIEVPSAPAFVLHKPPTTMPSTGISNKNFNNRIRRPPSICQAFGGFTNGLMMKAQSPRPSNDGVSVKV